MFKIKKKCFYIGLIYMMLAQIAYSQLPKTDVYLAELKNINIKPQILSVKFLNHFNRHGYNNQARFFGYNEVYMASAIDTSQWTDIYSIDLLKEELTRVTDTEKLSEFSPCPTPIEGYFSVVRIETDGLTQSLWIYPKDRSNPGKRALPNIKNIGYHTWISRDSVALFLVGTPNTFAIANISTGKTEIIAENIGRCIKLSPKGHISIVHKIKPDLWMLKNYDIKDKAFSTVCQMPQNTEDFDYLPNGILIAADGPKIKTFNTQKDIEWVEIADFTLQNIMHINRLNVIRDRLLFINNKN
ncbi:MAG: hypothetical protein IPO92_12045 [Saprospiraceae bacterium]|nr:hypothetical protein [Saprospiraceae bacterium]